MDIMTKSYANLIQRYLRDEINADLLQTLYFEKFKAETKISDERIYLILDAFFADLDSFCADPILLTELHKKMPGVYISEEVLRRRALRTVDLLED